MQSTVAIFRRLYGQLPPLFPSALKEKMHHALEHLENDPSVPLSEVEDTMIKFGYEVWPWNRAFKEFLAVAEGAVGEHFLLPRLSPDLQEKYRHYRHLGMTLRDLHSGSPAEYFDGEERGELCEALVAMQGDLRAYTAREVCSTKEKEYLRRVEEFKILLDEIESYLDNLRALADAESEHPNLAAEIRAQVRAFEEGLCLLGPELDYDAVCRAGEFFSGRRHELNRMRGIHVPIMIEF